MKYDKKRLNGKQKKSLLKTFLIAAGSTLAVCSVVLIAGVLIYNGTFRGQSKSQVKDLELTEEEQKFEEEKKELSNINKTIAVFGVDEDEVRTDVIFAVNFNSATGKAKVVSIPRDTKVNWSDKQKRAYNELTGYVMDKPTKLNEMAAYGRINQNVGNIRDFTIDEMENILKVKIDNYVVINLDAFREIVDAIGGVDMNVPQSMNYDDYAQGLHIHLQEGMQHLDSEDAEGIVRFRKYLQGDEQRVAVQQIFLKAVAEKVLSPEMRSQLPNVITKMFPYVKTDVKLTEVLSYLDLLNNFDLSDLKFYTVPGYGASTEGPSYYYINDEELETMIKQVFYSTEESEGESTEEAESDEPVIDKTVGIEIYNAAGVKGLATQYKDKLMTSGYNVMKFDNYKETGIEKSTIYAKDKKKATQFLEYVENAEIVEDATIDSDIMIVLGKNAIK